MSRLDEEILHKEIVPQFPTKPSTTDEDFGSPKQNTIKKSPINSSMSFQIGGVPNHTILRKERAKTRTNLSS